MAQRPEAPADPGGEAPKREFQGGDNPALTAHQYSHPRDDLRRLAAGDATGDESGCLGASVHQVADSRPQEGSAMKATVVRYQAKPDRADENQGLIEAVFADLEARQPEGFTYKVFRLEDGVSFIHVVIEHDDVEIPTRCKTSPRSRNSSAASSSVVTCPRSRWARRSSAAIAERACLLVSQPMADVSPARGSRLRHALHRMDGQLRDSVNTGASAESFPFRCCTHPTAVIVKLNR